jgi:hypothetical protein
MITRVSQRVSDAAFAAVRKFADDSGYGSFLTNENARAIGDVAALAAVRAALEDSGAKIVNPEQPFAPE